MVIGIGMAIAVLAAIIDARNKKIQEYTDIAGGFLFLLITGLIQIAMYFVKTRTFEGNAISIGILVSLIVTIYSTIKDIQKVSNEKEFLKEKVTAKELKIEKLTYQSLETLASTIDAKDKYTNGHSNRVANYSREIARRMGKDEAEIIAIYFMGLLHDIGKIGVRDDIINKTSKLTDEEFMVIKNHPTIGYNILKNMTEIPNIEYGARWHHERYDGKGYPDGLKGEQIPEYARIICVADAYDAMTSTRSYRAVMSQEKVRNEIENCRGKQFDPIIAQIMIEMIDEDINYTMKEKL
jgi:putative two-component system response regulator